MAWEIQFICCGRDDGRTVCATWGEADALRESYISGPGVQPHGYSASASASGHRRAAIVTRLGTEAP